ncbi:hypothetical protein CPB84DRAFT_1632253, partial [Gymnopilus junonius]
LPEDALHEIFYHCLPTHCNSIIPSKEAPVLLMHICSKWQATVLSSPHLWSQLHITFSDAYHPNIHSRDWDKASELETRELQAQALMILKDQCTIVETWLRCSGSCPLSISI